MLSRLTAIASAGVLIGLAALAACGDSQSVQPGVPAQPVAKQPAPAVEAPTAAPLRPEAAPIRSTPEPPNTPRPASTVPKATPTSTSTPESTPLSLAGQIPPTATPSPTAIPVLPTPIPEAMQAKLLSELDAEYRLRCLHAVRESEQPVTYLEFRELDPVSMTDIERTLWRQQLGSGPLKWCKDYWSEPLSVKNANKRSDSYRDRCYAQLWDGHQRVVDAKFLHFDQYARIANWMDIPGEELVEMSPEPLDLVIAAWEGGGEIWQTSPLPDPTDEWAGLFRYSEPSYGHRPGAWPGNVSHFEGLYPDGDCAQYYPQLFVGRWIPIDTAVTLQEMQVEAMRTTPTPQSADMAAWINQRDRPVFIVR